MKQSKAGQRLNPIIAKFTAPIFEADPKRYQRLCLWVWTQQKHGWPDEAIAKALEMAGAHVHRVDNWWTYLTKIMPKAKAVATEKESEDFKSGDMALATEFVEFLKKRARA